MQHYSYFFSTIYDESKPVADIGRGSHHSVLRAVLWHPSLAFHDFIVVWDEDHDTRIIWVAEQLLVQGLLSSVLAIGERKGGVSVLTSSRPTTKYKEQVARITQSVPSDSFSSSVAFFPESDGGIIQDEEDRSKTYLAGICALWRIGTKDPAFSGEASV